MEKFIPLVNGWSFRHLDLEGFIPGLYRMDIVQLSDIGLDIFNAGLQSVIDRAVFFYGGVMKGFALVMAYGVKSYSFAGWTWNF